MGFIGDDGWRLSATEEVEKGGLKRDIQVVSKNAYAQSYETFKDGECCLYDMK